MGLTWNERTSGNRIKLFATSDAASWVEVQSDFEHALPRLLGEMADRLIPETRYVMLITLWHESGRVIFQAYRRGRAAGTGRVALQFLCPFISTTHDEFMSGCKGADAETERNFANAFDSQVMIPVGDAALTEPVRSGWGRVLERVEACVVYVQRADEDDTRQPVLDFLPPADD
jgi:hypothetical protein